jgi:hypothetical protein
LLAALSCNAAHADDGHPDPGILACRDRQFHLGYRAEVQSLYAVSGVSIGGCVHQLSVLHVDRVVGLLPAPQARRNMGIVGASGTTGPYGRLVCSQLFSLSRDSRLRIRWNSYRRRIHGPTPNWKPSSLACSNIKDG